MNETFSKSELTAWLESDNQGGELPAVLRALDSLYLAGPTADEITKSQIKLHRLVHEWSQQVIFYDGSHGCGPDDGVVDNYDLLVLQD